MIDYPRAWQIVEASKIEDHNERCSYRTTEGCILCDCHVLALHPENLANIMYTKDGIPWNELEYIESRIGCTRY